MMSAAAYRTYLGIIFLAAAALLLTGSWLSYTSTFDTATVGLMSVNISGGERPLFYYGQPYFGALEAYLGAAWLALFGFSEFVVSLSPITFTLGWVLFTGLLFTRIHSREAGIVAAAVTGFSGYYVYWYSVATYGGYPAVFFLGTVSLWLGLRIWQDKPRGAALLLHTMILGTVMGLGVWVHALVFPYLAVAGAMMGCVLLRNRFPVDGILAFLLMVGLTLAGFVPFYLETGSFLGGVSERVPLSWAVVRAAMTNLFTVNIQELVVWNFLHVLPWPWLRACVRWGAVALAAAPFLLAGVALVRPRRSTGRVYYLVPLLFCLLFLALYVQHHMATIRAPRYAIGFWCMASAGAWSLGLAGQGSRRLRTTGWLLLALWITYQVTGTVQFIRANREGALRERTLAADVATAAGKRGLKTVLTCGDTLFGLKGQKFSMYAQNRVRFAHMDAERYARNAQAAETDPGRGYLATPEYAKALTTTLDDLGLTYDRERIHDYLLVSGVRRTPRPGLRAVPAKEVGDGSVTDGFQDTAGTGDEVVLDTKSEHVIAGVWLFTAPDLFSPAWQGPGSWEVRISRDGEHYEQVYASPVPRLTGYHAGPLEYVGGPWGVAEAFFTPVAARYVKIRFSGDRAAPVTEAILFEAGAKRQGTDPEAAETITRIAKERDLRFVWADRWLSGMLRQRFQGTDREEIALERYTTRYRNRPLQRFIRPRSGTAVACADSVADTCETALVDRFGKAVIAERIEPGSYALFLLSDIPEAAVRTGPALLWNGQVLLSVKDEDLLAPWRHSLGAPVWRADYTRTRGVYPDSWTGGKGEFLGLDYLINKDRDRYLVIRTHGWRPGNDPASLRLAVVANGETQLPFEEKAGNTYVFLLPDDLDRLDRLEIRTSTFVPGGPDQRRLGLDIERIEIRPAL
ncbi:MAG: hypothetical protein Kow0089_00420 [Desulfobulbaceae bacterium]